MTTTTARDIARFLVAEYPDKGATWAMKVAYYIQGWKLAWVGEPMFADRIEAWTLGPVSPAAYHADRAARTCRERGEAVTWTLPPELEAHARTVADHYRPYSGGDLVKATHRETPWSAAYGREPSFNSHGRNPIIEVAAIASYFGQQALLEGEGPARPPTTGSGDSWAVDFDELNAVTAETSKRWREALELLSR